MKSHFSFLIPLFLIISCVSSDPNDEIDEGFISDETYTNEEIGWSMDVPRGWEITTKQAIQESNERGLEIVEENTNIKIDASGLKHLLNFESDDGSSFMSNIEPFPIEDKSQWDENEEFIYQLIQEAYDSQGIQYQSDRYTERVDDLVFNVIKIELLGDENELLMTQLIFTRHIIGYNFGATLNCTSEESKKTLLTAWRTSKFSIRE